MGAVYDNIGFFALATTCTMSASNTALTSVADVTGITTGMTIKGPGIKAGTTVAAVSAGSITLSQTTTAGAAGSSIPILVRNANRYSAGGGYDTEWFEDGATFQSNGTAALAAYGFNLTLTNVHFEGNNQPSVSTGTSTISQSARVIPNRPITISDSIVEFYGGTVGETVSTSMAIINGSKVRFHGTQLTGHIIGDYTSYVEFYGYFADIVGQVTVPVNRWPDSFHVNSGSGWMAYGETTQIRTRGVPNAYTKVNPRLPLLEGAAGGATVSYVRDATYGPASKVQFAASAGGLGTHSVDTQWVAAGVAVGDWVLWSRIMWADRYTSVHIRGTSGSGSAGGDFVFTLTPYPQRIVIVLRVATADSGTKMYVYPVGSDAPAIYCQNEMQVVAADGDNAARKMMCATLREGLFNDGTNDGALVGTATYDPPSLATGISATVTTVTVTGAVVGDSISRVSFSLDSQGVDFSNAWVSAANTVSIIPRNGGTGTVDLASGTLTVHVIPA